MIELVFLIYLYSSFIFFLFYFFSLFKADGQVGNALLLLFSEQCLLNEKNEKNGTTLLQLPENLPLLSPLQTNEDCSPQQVLTSNVPTFNNRQRKRRSKRTNKKQNEKKKADGCDTMIGWNATSKETMDKLHVFCRNHMCRATIYKSINENVGKKHFTSNRSSKTFNSITKKNEVAVRVFFFC